MTESNSLGSGIVGCCLMVDSFSRRNLSDSQHYGFLHANH